MRTNLAATLALALMLLTVTSSAQDYPVEPVPLNLTADQATTFLVDLSSPKTQADRAAGIPLLGLNPAGFIPGGGYKGSLSFASATNLPANAWTIEMVVRLHYDAAGLGDITLCSWNNPLSQFTFGLLLSQSWGPQARFYCSSPTDYFYSQPYAGGNGRSIQASALDKWVYVTFGCDFAAQRSLVIARELNGDLLNRDINFAATPLLDTSFLSGFPLAQQAGELARRWLSTGARFAQSMPATISFGHNNAEIRSIRISKGYRADILEIAPLLPSHTPSNWVPSDFPSLARTQTVSRTVGYGGYANYRTMNVAETYFPMAVGNAPIVLQLTNVPAGLYSFYVYGCIAPNGRTNLNRVWQPCPMNFKVTSASGTNLAFGRMLLKQALRPRRMQGFHVHVPVQTNVSVVFQLHTNAMETAWIQHIAMVDQLSTFPDVAIKKAQNIAVGATSQDTVLTDARKLRDDAIWSALPPLNTPLQIGGGLGENQVTEFQKPPSGISPDTWVTKAFKNLLLYQEVNFTFSPLDFVNTNNGAIFVQSNILNAAAWPGAYGEDPTGVFFKKASFPSLTTDIYNTKRAELLGHRYLLFACAIMNSRGTLWGLDLPLSYFNGGDTNIGHDAALALVRLAYDWPALEMNLHETRLCTHSPDFAIGNDLTTTRNGKMQYEGWSGDHAIWLFEAYDQVFPYIKNNQVFADAVHRFIPWVNTPADVVRMLDRYLVWASVRDTENGLINASVGVHDAAAQVLGPGPQTMPLFDLTQQYAALYPIVGTYQEMYGTALSRSGCYYIGSWMVYAYASAQDLIEKASRMKAARLAGVSLPMDLSDVSKYVKPRSAAEFIIDGWVAGGFPLTIGDASGGTHVSNKQATNVLSTADGIATLDKAFDLYGGPRQAWLLKNWFGRTSASIVSAAATTNNPILYNHSRVIPDYAAILELMPDESNVLNKTSATLRLGIGQGHSHHDYLDLNLFGMGLPLAVDLACRDEGDNWSRPGAGWSFLHNHALAHNTDDPNGAGLQTGEPWLRAFAPPLLRASYVDQTGAVQVDRDTLLMPVGNTGTFYAFDVQRLRGGVYHTWAFHGCESDSVQLNVPMQNQTVRWIDRLLEGTQKVGRSTNNLQAAWTMTRNTNNFAYAFNGGGTLRTVACESTVLGPLYNPALPGVKVRATLLGRGNDTVLQGNPYSDVYSYSFPFLWVQCTNEVESVYPAVYEWYRGNAPTVAGAQVLQTNPLKVQVTTVSGQIDTYEFTPDYCLAVSRDSQGVRWAKLSGSAQITLSDLSLHPASNYDVAITGIDYAARRLTTSGTLPGNPGAIAGNNGRKIFLQLYGSGTSFGWPDDLLVAEGEITDLHVTGPNSVSLTSNQRVLFGGSGNRKAEAMTQTTEDGQWHFRGSNVVHRPVGVPLTTGVFTDANGDGHINVKTYEIGLGDRIALPVEITLQRSSTGWLVLANTPLRATVNATTFDLPVYDGWREVTLGGQIRPFPPTNLRFLRTN